jgi:hypothetical protein
MAEKKLIVVHVAYDPEAKVWWTESSDLFGLNACASSLDEFRTILPGMVQDLIELNEPSRRGTTSSLRSSPTAASVSTFRPQHDGLRQAIAR